MDVRAVSPSGVTAGACGDLGNPELAWIKADGEVDGPADEVLVAHTHAWRDVGAGSPLDPWTCNQHAINDSGTWVSSAEPDFGEPFVPAILSNGDTPDFLPMPAGWTTGSADVINAGGTIVGMVNNDVGERALAIWDGSVRAVPTGAVADWWGPELLGDDGTVVGSCTVLRCYYLLPPGGTEFERFPASFDVRDEDGRWFTANVVRIQDINGLGQLLVVAEEAGSLEVVTMLVTPTE